MYFKEEDKIFKQEKEKEKNGKKSGKWCGNIQGTAQGLLLKKGALQAIIRSQTKTREEHHEKKNDF